MSPTQPSTTLELTETIDAHLALLNEPQAAVRAPAIQRVWNAGGRQVDPTISGEGHDGISTLADAVHTHFAGHRFRRISAVDAHNRQFRYAWELVRADGIAAITGVDVGEVDEQGRLLRVVGFYGELAPAGAA